MSSSRIILVQVKDCAFARQVVYGEVDVQPTTRTPDLSARVKGVIMFAL